jgi:hypothetical protein
MSSPKPTDDTINDRPHWTARSGEDVGIGDVVALSLLEHRGAIGLVEAATEDGGVSCLLMACDSCPPGRHVAVQEDQLLVMVKRGGDSRKVNSDYDFGCWPRANSFGAPKPGDDPETDATDGEGQSAA